MAVSTLTSQRLKKEINAGLERERRKRDESDRKTMTQLEWENKRLGKLINTPIFLRKVVTESLVNVDFNKLAGLVRKNFFNPSVMKTLLHVVDVILFQGSDGRAMSTSVREWFRNLKQIGPPSVEGMALLSSVGDVDAALIIKTERSGNSTLIHELYVGMALNSLRDYGVYNFAYVFGAFKCLPPVLNEKKEVLTWCNVDSGNSATYVIYERIAPATSLGSYVSRRGATVRDFLDVYLQLILALAAAHRRCDFTHFDLHHENVLVRDLGREVLLPYDFDGTKLYLRTRVIASIIDYGFAHVKYDGKDLGKFGFSYVGVDNSSYPMHDLYKVLCFSLYSMMESGAREPFQSCSSLLRYFVAPRVNIRAFLREQRNEVYSLPRFPDFEAATHRSLLLYVLDTFPNETAFLTVKKVPGVEVFGCEYLSCPTVSGVLKQVGAVGFPKPDDVSEFYEEYIRLKRLSRSEDMRKVYSNMVEYFSKIYKTKMKEELKLAKSLIERYYLFVDVVSKVSSAIHLKGRTPSSLFRTGKSREVYFSYVDNLVVAFDVVVVLDHVLESTSSVSKVYGDNVSKDLERQRTKLHESFSRRLAPRLNALKEDHEVLREARNKSKTNRLNAVYDRLTMVVSSLPL